MITVAQAQQLIASTIKIVPVQTIPFIKANGRILREDVIADRPQPAFNKSLMDGIAIQAKCFSSNQRSFIIEATIPAGVTPKPLKRANACVRIMTGAVLPKGCDAVVPIERITVEGEHATINGPEIIYSGQFVRVQGADVKQGDIVIKRGCRLDPIRIALAAAVGKKSLKVSSLLKVAFVSTGDELVAADMKNIKPYQTRMTNAYAIQTLLESERLAIVNLFHVKDDQVMMRQKLRKIIQDHQVVILSGGVSKGDFDYVPTVLKDLKIKQIFHEVAQKPGKPFYFGKTSSGKVIFGLPGNPVSTFVCAMRYVLPYFYACAQYDFKQDYVRLGGQPKHLDSKLTQFIVVKIERRQGDSFAYPINTGGSGDFFSLTKADGFIEYDQDSQEPLRPYFSWRL